MNKRFTRLLLAFCLAGLPAAASAEEGPALAPAADQVRPLLVGSPVPQAELLDAEGEAFDLAAALKEQPTILVFYRGHW